MVLQAELTLKVKNTFIDVDDKYAEFDLDDQDLFRANAVRQLSEPTPQTFLRQISTGIALERRSKPFLNPAINEVLPEETIEPEMRLCHLRSDVGEDSTSVAQVAEQGWARTATCERQESFETAHAPAAAYMPGIFDMRTAVDALSFVPAAHMMAMQGADMEVAMHGAGYVVGFQPKPYNQHDLSESAMGMVANSAVTKVQQAPKGWEQTYTVMMRNLPNKYTQQMLLAEINLAGFRDAFDFLYLPVDPETNANKGYAFINFVDPDWAWAFKDTFEGKKMERFNSHKFVSVVPAALQGFEANHAHYSTARVSRGDPNTRPLFLREPLQTKKGRSNSAQRRRRRGGRISLVDQAALRAGASKRHGGDGRTVASAAPSKTMTDAFPGAIGAGPAIKFCPYCGGKVLQGFQYCQYCGSLLPHA